jgi:hypothetical protein
MLCSVVSNCCTLEQSPLLTNAPLRLMTEEEKKKFTLLVTVYIYFNCIPKFPGRAPPDASTFFQVPRRRDDQKARSPNLAT